MRLTLVGALILTLAGCQSRPPFTVAVLPDTQYYAEANDGTYEAQARWIADNAAQENIRFVIHLGDITHNNKAAEWGVASGAHAILEGAGIPYSVVPGNHDMPKVQEGKTWRRRDTSKYNDYFGPWRFASVPWYGGHWSSGNENNYCFFEVGDLQFMVISLELAPRKDVLCWADSLIRSHPERRVILATHCYLDRVTEEQEEDGVSTKHKDNCSTRHRLTGSDGKVMFDELVRRHSNVFLVLAGHITDSEWRTVPGSAGNPVHEMLVDYQKEPKNGGGSHGNGWFRLLRFVPEDGEIQARTVSALGASKFDLTDLYDEFPDQPDHQFELPYVMDGDIEGEYVFTSVADRFHDRTVNSNGTRDQLLPSIASASSGAFVVAWEDDSSGAEDIFQIHARGFTSFGCQRFSEITVNTNPSGQQRDPDIACDANGNFVVVWEDDSNKNDTYQIKARGFYADGTQRLAPWTVNAVSAGQQVNPAIAMDRQGNFAIVWQDDSKGAEGVYQIYAKTYYADGSVRKSDFTVNTVSSGQQRRPDVAMDWQGNYVVVWEDDRNENDTYQIRMRGFDADSVQRIPDETVNDDSKGQQLRPAIAMDADGDYAVVWQDDSKDPEGVYQIYGKTYYADGAVHKSDFTVNEVPKGQQRRPDVSMDSDGVFVVVWEDDKNDNDIYQIYMRGFDLDGDEVIDSDSVNHISDGQQLRPRISTDDMGRFVVTWQDDLNDNGWYQVLARGLMAAGE